MIEDYQTIAFSKTFQGSFGRYKSLEHLDRLNAEGNVQHERAIRKIFLRTIQLIKQVNTIEKKALRKLVFEMLEQKMLVEHRNLALFGKEFSLTQNFIITKIRQGKVK